MTTQTGEIGSIASKDTKGYQASDYRRSGLVEIARHNALSFAQTPPHGTFSPLNASGGIAAALRVYWKKYERS